MAYPLQNNFMWTVGACGRLAWQPAQVPDTRPDSQAGHDPSYLLVLWEAFIRMRVLSRVWLHAPLTPTLGGRGKWISVGLRLACSTQESQGSQRYKSDRITKFKWGLGVGIRVLGLASFQSSLVMLRSSGVHLLETEML